MPGCTGGEKRGKDLATMQVKKKNQFTWFCIKTGSQSKVGLSPAEADAITDVTPFELAETQNKENVFSADGNRPYLL